MIDQVTQLIYPGRINPRAAIPARVVEEVKGFLELLPAPPAIVSTEIRAAAGCWPPNKLDAVTYLYAFADGRLAYVTGKDVDFAGAPRWDACEDLAKRARELLATGQFTGAVCSIEGDPGLPVTCGCSGAALGLDLGEWHFAAVVNHNNCYSYARRKRWVDGRQGSQPGRRESESVQDIVEGLYDDGLVDADRRELSGKGEFIALFIRGKADYHFFRLDGDYWTHKFSGLPVATCDYQLNSIAKDALESASLPGFAFHAYFRVPPGVELDHCQ